MYVYVSPEVETAAQRQGVIKAIEALRDRIEADASLFNLLFDIRFPLWIRRMKSNLRLIATLKLFGEDQVLCLTHILLRGGSEYREFLDDPAKWEQHHIDLSSLTAYLERRKQVQPIAKRPLPKHLYPWLDRPVLMRRDDRGDTVVFESQLWVKLFQPDNSPYSQYLTTIYGIVEHLLFATAEAHYIIEPTRRFSNVQICSDPETELCVLFSRVRPPDDPQREILFLLQAFESKPTEAEVGNVGNTLRLFGSNVAHNQLSRLTARELSRYVHRSYPDYIAIDLEHWQAVELEPNTNLALSGEEEELLHHMTFPAFINGRAGSGKSTMLHYAFAYYCELYLQQLSDSAQTTLLVQPLFLTYSDRLTEKARDTVRRILMSHAYYMSRKRFQASELEALDHCFQTLQTFLLSCLPDAELPQFARRNYISFHEFKQRYNRSFSNKKFSAEECWHTIRTYIKGYHFIDDHQDYLSVEEYQEEINKKYKKVTNENFKRIYDEVWQWYREQCQRDRLWDDQDLARAVLKAIANGTIAPAHYAAIFCDEAQDFTRIEFQLILRLSIWSQYQLPIVVNSLPFAFAGDPLQTLNPTGFSWTGFCASFYEKVLTPLDPDNSRHLDSERLILHELRQNYRSPAAVVKFTNCIHLWRRTLFDLKTLEPQEPWWKRSDNQPQKGILHNNLTSMELRRLAESGAIFLLPCDEGGELEFLQRTAILSDVFPTVRTGQIPPTVYTPVGLKGLELSPVVVCFFGEYYFRHFNGRPLQSLTNPTNNLQLEYFLNKLYVAVSRSTGYLAIVDTAEGDRCLWQEAGDRNIQLWLSRMALTSQQKQRRSAYLEQWRDNLNTNIQPINLRGLTQVDLQLNGKQWLLTAIENHNVHNLETAIFYYQKAGMTAEVNYCKAWIFRLENQLQTAGRAFMAIDTLSDPELLPQQQAWQCFWAGQCWRDLSDWLLHYPLAPQAELQPVVQFMLATEGERISPDAVTDFSHFLRQDVSWHHQRGDHTWRAVIDRYRQAITQILNQPQSLMTAAWQIWSEVLQISAEVGFAAPETLNLAGKCLFQMGDFAAALALWDTQNYTQHPDYCIAKAEITLPPENIPWLAEAQMYDRMIQLWQEHDRPIAGKWATQLSYLRQACRQTQRSTEWLDLELQTGQWLAAVKLCQQSNLPDADRLKVIERMAYDVNLTPATVRQQRDLLSQFVTQTTATPTWQATEARILEACVAIEKIGEYRSALPLLERLLEHPQLSRSGQTFIQQRWLVVKGNQAEFLEHRGKVREAQRHRQERDRQAQAWGIHLNQLTLDIPTLPLSLPYLTPMDSGDDRSWEEAQLREQIQHSLGELNLAELQQVSHYLKFLQYLRQASTE
ncbi:UvrD-helicase domain-containing protein [Pantanalinema rosaneae CENA516]|uniref:UvrD-helicase domain-containing protein n=1 Tax=Pantanalinema rosaneae TaxID=1620701 RepID=UPI003D6E82C1